MTCIDRGPYIVIYEVTFLSGHYFRSIKLLTAISIGCALGYPAIAGPIVWDPSAIGLTGASSFTADALKGNETSHIMFTGPTSFVEHGFIKVTGILQNGLVTTPNGLNSTYSLYFDFTATGDSATGVLDTLGLTLYGVNGEAIFGIDGSNNAFVDNGSRVAVALATNAFIKGMIGGAPGTDLSADTFSTFSATPAGKPVFLSPSLPAVFHGAFFHSVLEPGGIAFVSDGIVLRGGDDTLTFVPEPSSLALLICGLGGILIFRRKVSRYRS